MTSQCGCVCVCVCVFDARVRDACVGIHVRAHARACDGRLGVLHFVLCVCMYVHHGAGFSRYDCSLMKSRDSKLYGNSRRAELVLSRA